MRITPRSRARAAAIGAALSREYDIAPGDRVALFATNCTQYLECLYGILWIGAVAIPINAKLHGREAAWICGDAGAKLTFVSDDTIAALLEAKSELPPAMITRSMDSSAFRKMRDGEGAPAPLPREVNDLAWLFYTSGTTGRPKGVMLSHGNLVAMSLCYLADVDQATPNDASLYAAPISHGAGLYNFPHVRMGGRHVIPESRGFDADEVLNLGRQLGNVVMFAAPTMVRRLVDAAKHRGENGEGIRTIIYGGGPMYLADIRDAIATMGQRFVQIYGQGEIADDNHRARPRLAQAIGPSALSRTPGFRRNGAKRDVGSHHRRRWQAAAAGRNRRDRGQGDRRDARLLE